MAVPDDAAWHDLSPNQRAELEAKASATLERDRREWGMSGLSAKLERLMSPSNAMAENIDRVLAIEVASELPNGFTMSRDVSNAALKQALLRVYLDITDGRADMLHDHPEFKAWDGGPVKEFWYRDHEHQAALHVWAQETEQLLAAIPSNSLTPVEEAIRRKIGYRLRRNQLDRPHVASAGELGYASLYKLDASIRPFSSDDELLNAYNASMFSEVRSVDRGTLESFAWNLESEFNDVWLKDQGMSEAMAKAVLKLGHLYQTRMERHPDADKACTIYSPDERARMWTAFTAAMIANADGAETIESYASTYREVAKRRTDDMRALAKRTLDTIFTAGSNELTEAQRARIKAALDAESQAAAMLDTMKTQLKTVAPRAFQKLDTLLKEEAMVGGYSDGGPLRPDDERQILEMWQKARAFIQRRYRGYAVDIGSLVPERPSITTTGDAAIAIGGNVSIGLKKSWSLVSLSSTLLHEIKHAIDQRSRAAVEGAAIEGASTLVERMVWPDFVQEAMANEASRLPLARLLTEVDNVRFTATTDATLQILMRRSCDPPEPDTIEFARGIVRSYGYTDEPTLSLRSKRAHNATQYLSYDYGLVKYGELVEYLQAGIGPSPRVDPFLLQACGMPSPNKSAESVAKLRACIAVRRS